MDFPHLVENAVAKYEVDVLALAVLVQPSQSHAGEIEER